MKVVEIPLPYSAKNTHLYTVHKACLIDDEIIVYLSHPGGDESTTHIRITHKKCGPLISHNYVRTIKNELLGEATMAVEIFDECKIPEREKSFIHLFSFSGDNNDHDLNKFYFYPK